MQCRSCTYIWCQQVRDVLWRVQEAAYELEGKLFHAAGPEQQKPRCANLVLVLGSPQSAVSVDLSLYLLPVEEMVETRTHQEMRYRT